MGITDGRKNSNELIDSIYNALGFDHVATSDYQKINYFGKENEAFIPTYEHGYNIFKTHQVCIGSDKVLWTDLMFGQTLSMKQWVIDLLREDNRIVVLAHPLLRHGYSISDMTYLTNYQAIEVLNNVRVSIDHWDEALSSGQMAWIIGNDDAHDVVNSNEVGRRFTMINSSTTNSEEILENLEKGNAYGMDFIRIDDEPMNDKIVRSKNLHYLLQAELKSDTLNIKVDTISSEIRFITDKGNIIKNVNKTNSTYCIVEDEYPFLRTEIEFYDGSVMYLNPIIRYSGDQPISMKTAEIDSGATLRLRIIYFLVALVIAYFIARRRKIKKAK